MPNYEGRISYALLDTSQLQLFVFVNGLFANNKNLSSQLGYVMILRNETPGSLSYGDNSFTLKGNLLHTFSTKSKKVIRSVLVSEIYGIISGVNITIAINSTIKKITKQIGFLINRKNNLANVITKMLLNPSLKTFLDENQVIVRVQGWVKR
ncbi:hypothetical protein DL98DRAFT_554728 [Cadophora sp. DSE1049]|nr:hypothetical protein DL98DRAFT_554728 [Cadophora sp. DSE1049]